MNAQPDYLDFVRTKLHERRGEWRDISVRSGVPYFTISKISTGKTQNPRWNTLQALVGVLSDDEHKAA